MTVTMGQGTAVLGGVDLSSGVVGRVVRRKGEASKENSKDK